MRPHPSAAGDRFAPLRSFPSLHKKKCRNPRYLRDTGGFVAGRAGNGESNTRCFLLRGSRAGNQLSFESLLSVTAATALLLFWPLLSELSEFESELPLSSPSLMPSISMMNFTWPSISFDMPL